MRNVRLKRLKSDEEAVRRLVRVHPKIDIEGVSGNPPDRYILILRISGLQRRGKDLDVADEHRMEVRLPLGYPRDAPVCRMLTPVFHPNIAPHAVCVGDHWTAAESLDHLFQRVGEMICFQSYNTKSPLNGQAAQWADENPDKLPLVEKEFFIDMKAAQQRRPASETTLCCSNCGESGDDLESCSKGHRLCPQCAPHCNKCGRLFCLPCGVTRCVECEPQCSNCKSEEQIIGKCGADHVLCANCTIPCEQCGRNLCLVCGEPPCRSCSA